MTAIKEDKTREDRIHMEIIVDANGPEEQVMGWYYYLQDSLSFPFQARCIARKPTSPLSIGEDVEVSDMASDEVYQHDMLVEVKWKGRMLSVPLSQLEAMKPDAKTEEAMADWNYWLIRGYEL